MALLAGVGLWAWLRGGPTPVAPPAPASAPVTGPRRVISLSPAMTEMLFALGVGDRVVGVTDFCAYPPEAAQRPRCGGFLNPNLEAIADLEPDLLVLQGLHDTVRDWCAANGRAYVAFELDSLADLRAALRGLGTALGESAAAEALIARLEGELLAVRRAVDSRPAVPVFVCTGRAEGPPDVLNTCGGGSFLSELATIAGGRNVFGELPELYPQPSLEALSERSPAAILDLRPGQELDDDARRRIVGEWSALATLPAVRDGRVVVLTETHVLLPGPRAGATARVFARALHPDLNLPEP